MTLGRWLFLRFIPCLACCAAFGDACCAGPSRQQPEPGATKGRPATARSVLRTWEEERAKLEQAWRSLLGTGPRHAPELSPQVIEAEGHPAVLRIRLRYQVLTGVWTEAFLIEPLRDAGPRPGVVVFHSTNPAAHEQPAGRADRPWLHLALLLARHGYVVLAPRCFIFEPGDTYAGHARRLLSRWPRWTGMGRMLWDGGRALDLVEKHPRVDRQRLAAVGHSLGAKETLYLAAFDRRVRAAVFSEGGISLKFSNWDAPWYLGDQIRALSLERDHDELLKLIAPRWFLLIGGGAADGQKSRPYVERARDVYRKLGVSDRLRLFVHDKGHRLPAEAREAMLRFLAEALGEATR